MQQPVPGVSPLAITAIALLDSTGAASADFVSVPPPGSPPGGSVNIQNGQLVITVWLTPVAAGARNAILQISYNQPGSPLTVQLSDTGNPAPLLTFSPGSLNFDPKKLTNHTVTLGNTGTAPLMISNIAIVDSNYSMSNTCNFGAGGGTLQPGQQCTINVVCRFTGPGGTSQMVITHNAAGSPTVIELNATSKSGLGDQKISAASFEPVWRQETEPSATKRSKSIGSEHSSPSGSMQPMPIKPASRRSAPKPVAGFPAQVGNDKRGSHQESKRQFALSFPTARNSGSSGVLRDNPVYRAGLR